MRFFWGSCLVLQAKRRLRNIAPFCAILSPSCGPHVGTPCFDGTYDVQLLERVDEKSTCPEPWASAWTFQVSPRKVSVKGAYGECSQVALRLEANLPRNLTGFGVADSGAAGAIDGRYPSDSTDACPAWSGLEAYLLYGAGDVSEAAADDGVLWKMDIIDIDDSCGIPVPDGGRCTDVYRSRMTKVAEWDGEEGE
jgi:hypothetical protein